MNTNPFSIRATEYMDNDSSFLRLVTPEPLHYLFKPHAATLFHILIRIIGTPGSGKTTIAHLVTFRRMMLIVNQWQHNDVFKPLMNELKSCGFIKNEQPIILATRIPIEPIYRDFHELPYDNDLKFRLMWSLIQSRAVLGWINELMGAKISLDTIQIHAKPGAEVNFDGHNQQSAQQMHEQARHVERAIHQVVTSLIPLPVSDLPTLLRQHYNPLNAIGKVTVAGLGKTDLHLRPLLILDDAHELHPKQREKLERELKRREFQVGRWMMMRMDTLEPTETVEQFSDNPDQPTHGTQRHRDYEIIRFQDLSRSAHKNKTSKMLSNMADSYLKRWNVFNTHQINHFSHLLDETPIPLTDPMETKLEKQLMVTQDKLGISCTERQQLEKEISQHFDGRADDEKGTRLMSLSILMHRLSKKRGGQLSLFDNPVNDRTLPKMSTVVAHAARLELHRRYSRPYYFGMKFLIASSSYHPETFLQLAGSLAEHARNRLLRNKSEIIPPREQEKLLLQRAKERNRYWDFSLSSKVHNLAKQIAEACHDMERRGTARNGAGNNAVGILEQDFQHIVQTEPEIIQILQLGLAYLIIEMVRDYAQGKKRWRLIKLSGPMILENNLTLYEGGFIEWTSSKLIKAMAGEISP